MVRVQPLFLRPCSANKQHRIWEAAERFPNRPPGPGIAAGYLEAVAIIFRPEADQEEALPSLRDAEILGI